MSASATGEEYATIRDGEGKILGYAYAVTLVSGVVRRRHDPAPIEEQLTRWTPAGLPTPPGKTLWFSGVAGLPGDEDGDDALPVATYAGAVRSDQVAEIGYWSPEDERPSREAHQAATALLFSLYQAGSAMGGLLGNALGGPAPAPAPPAKAGSPPGRKGLSAL